jgi:predicted lipid-binding transport protein (Tim44 family)
MAKAHERRTTTTHTGWGTGRKSRTGDPRDGLNAWSAIMTQDIDGSSLIALVLLALLYWNIWDSLRLFTPPDEDAKKQKAAGNLPSEPAGLLQIGHEEAGESAPNGMEWCATSAVEAILAIRSRDAAFDLVRFLASACGAYETIVTAFSEGDKDTLQRLVSPEVYEIFLAEIIERERKGERVETTFVHIGQPEVAAADIMGDRALITVHFVSEIFHITRSRTGEPVGDTASDTSATSQSTVDLWTFARAMTSHDRAWALVATE